MERMKALVFKGNKVSEFTDYADPTIDENGIIVKIMANGVCRSDYSMWYSENAPNTEICGHEMTGVVEEVGKNIKNFKPGDRVLVPFSGSDGTCPHCLEGNTNLCDSFLVPGATFNGGYAEYLSIPFGDRNLLHLPDAISFLDGAALGCRMMTAFHGMIDRAEVKTGDKVAVFGCGGIGLSAINIASSVGATVIAVDINEENLELARLMGAKYAINGKEENLIEQIADLTGGGVDISVDALGNQTTAVNSLQALKKKGKHLQIGVVRADGSGTMVIPTDLIVMKEAQFIGTLGMPISGFPRLLSLVEQGHLQPGKMVTAEISLSEVPTIFDKMSRFETKGTYVVTDFTK